MASTQLLALLATLAAAAAAASAAYPRHALLAATDDGAQQRLEQHVRRLLVPRVAGTAANRRVRTYIADELRALNYSVELDEFAARTPLGERQFANVVATSEPSACSHLLLACHFDSKLMRGGRFVGATDSAVPCAMLLELARAFAGRRFQTANSRLGLRLVFFDGEEAFGEWSARDSLYGSRHLAARWAAQPASSSSSNSSCRNRKAVKTELDKIELLVVLDLIGARDTKFVAFHARTRAHYDSLRRHERALLAAEARPPSRRPRAAPSLGSLLEALFGNSQQQQQQSSEEDGAFTARTQYESGVEDDHAPFEARDVPVLLLMSSPFPRVWHSSADEWAAIEWRATRRILAALEAFVGDFESAAATAAATRR